MKDENRRGRESAANWTKTNQSQESAASTFICMHDNELEHIETRETSVADVRPALVVESAKAVKKRRRRCKQRAGSSDLLSRKNFKNRGINSKTSISSFVACFFFFFLSDGSEQERFTRITQTRSNVYDGVERVFCSDSKKSKSNRNQIRVRIANRKDSLDCDEEQRQRINRKRIEK